MVSGFAQLKFREKAVRLSFSPMLGWQPLGTILGDILPSGACHIHLATYGPESGWVCLSGGRLPAEGQLWGVWRHKWSWGKAMSEGASIWKPHPSHTRQPPPAQLLQRAEPSGGLFCIRPWLAAKAHSPPLCAGIKGGGAAASEGCGARVSSVRCWVPFIKHQPSPLAPQ